MCGAWGVQLEKKSRVEKNWDAESRVQWVKLLDIPVRNVDSKD